MEVTPGGGRVVERRTTKGQCVSMREERTPVAGALQVVQQGVAAIGLDLKVNAMNSAAWSDRVVRVGRDVDDRLVLRSATVGS